MLAPRLSRSAHKGSCGRIAVVGGCDEYTGAPFFSAMAALRMGADQSTIFTCASAATPIKAYSPDICVTPSYERIFEQLTKYHAVVVGPGLGRDLSVTPSLVERIMAGCVAQKIPLLLDADALFVLPPLAGILKGYVWAVLTPNVVELKRLCEQLNVVEHTGPALALALQGPIVVVKGEVDTISGPAGPQPSSVSEGSPRRVSGQRRHSGRCHCNVSGVGSHAGGSWHAGGRRRRDVCEGGMRHDEASCDYGIRSKGAWCCYLGHPGKDNTRKFDVLTDVQFFFLGPEKNYIL